MRGGGGTIDMNSTVRTGPDQANAGCRPSPARWPSPAPCKAKYLEEQGETRRSWLQSRRMNSAALSQQSLISAAAGQTAYRQASRPIREGFEPRHSTRVATPRTMPTFDRVGVPPWRAPHSTIRRRHLTSTCIGPNRRGRDAQMIGNLSDRPLPELHAANGPILRSAAATPRPIRISFSVRQEWVNPW